VIGRLLAPPLCWDCGRPARAGEALCLACRRELRFLGAAPVLLAGVPVWAPVAYEGPARALVRALKFRGARAVADSMAAPMAARPLDEASVLVPVPLHPARLPGRGYNQAALLAGALARRKGLPVADCLARRGSPARQVGRGRAERLAGGPSVVIRSPPPARPLLVDDVATTGATLAACAAALRRAGAQRVEAVAFARTPGR
jgi:ComF family protein